MQLNIGFVGTRFQGLDGVSLESNKWADLLSKMKHNIFWFAGVIDKNKKNKYEVPEAYFRHPDILKINDDIFGKQIRTRTTTDTIYKVKEYLKDRLYEFIDRYKINLIIAENSLSIPVHIPLAIALTEVIAETGIPTIGHHHDFYWERNRFLVNSINDILDMAFPPDLPSIRHVVINTIAQKELAARKGLASILIPNVIDFNEKRPYFDEFNRDLRQQLGFSKSDILFLQPTRIVARKGIESAINLVSRLNNPKIKLIISHNSGDEGDDYYFWLQKLIKMSNVPVHFIYNRLHEKREVNSKGNKLYTLWDLYPHADFITYPSAFEGFGNAFIEAVYFKKPIIVNRYSIFVTDIEPKGFDVISFSGYLDDETVEKVREVLTNPRRKSEMVEKNYELAKKYFSYDILKRKIKSIFTEFYGHLNGSNGLK